MIFLGIELLFIVKENLFKLSKNYGLIQYMLLKFDLVSLFDFFVLMAYQPS